MNIFNKDINVFIGYQFKSDFYNSDTLQNIISEVGLSASDEIKKDDHDETLKYYNPNFQTTKFQLDYINFINTGVRDQIQNAAFCIFELSDRNPNVLYELGYAVGLKIPVIYLINNKQVTAPPSDLQGFQFVSYDQIENDSTKLSLKNAIKNAFKDYLKKNNIINLFWNQFTKSESINVFIGKNKESKPNFTSGDIEALEILRKKLINHAKLKLIMMSTHFEEPSLEP